jgi:dynein heavy chain 1
MTLIQKALGEYLEKQRQLFPRFYFVNNDDLVEIIGNSNEPSKIVTHIGKMFSSMTTLEMAVPINEDEIKSGVLMNANTMCSKEGECVQLSTPVKISIAVKEWLIQLESQMAITLASLLQEAYNCNVIENKLLLAWIDKFPVQIIILSSQISWTQNTEKSLSDKEVQNSLLSCQTTLENRLKSLSENVLQDMESSLRKKCEQLLTEMIHQRDVSRLIVAGNCTSRTDFQWLYHLRFYWNPKETNLMQNLCIKMANASFFYGFEYLGIGERLVQTPLTDRCYLTLTQALHFRMGANPFGPAGTGKTESVKMLGSQLGRFVLVFNCDSAFDYAAMGRIFAGLCQVGAWGCFDEFNRLEERILSAVSQQILTIQRGLMMQKESIELLGNSCKLHRDVGIFVTLNPGYAGRSNLPDNLKQLFRAVAMVIPDRKIIAQVMLFSQGIVTAEELAGKIVLLFTLCEEQLSSQPHYDFGLRALKSVLIGAGDLKRKSITEKNQSNDDNTSSDFMSKIEIDVLITSACDSILPKLVAEDIPLFSSLLEAVFPLSELPKINDAILLETIKVICEEDSLEVSDDWIEKVLQLKQVLDMRHGVMMVGPSGTGKTTAWRTLLKALSKVDGVKGNFYVIDPKSIKKDKLYGILDHNTLEWTDGVFTKLLRRVSEAASHRGINRRSWIIFDGDVDPEWAENLNSVLDDNRVLTLPSGDRLKLPNNVRIMMEVDTLKYATLATVSRCGMVWFPSSTVPLDILFKHHLKKLRKETIQLSDGSTFGITSGNNGTEIQKKSLNGFIECISPLFNTSSDLVGIALTYSLNQKHVMDVTAGQLISTLYSLLLRGISIAVEYNELNSDFPMSDSHMDLFATKWLLYSLLWAFGGSLTWDKRALLSDELTQHSTIEIPYSKQLIDLQVNVNDGSWSEWNTLVPKMEIESNKVIDSDVVITTTDTVRHCEVLLAWLQSHKPLLLCGPPGSGKTMTLTSVLESMPDLILASLNFSSGTTPDLILKTFAQYCEIVDSPDGLIMQPSRQSYRETQWLVVFCDEINLPDVDIYGTQTVIMFLRQLTEQGGFWNNDCKWVKLSKIQFVGACNPPEDAGRKPISPRFLRHASLLLVDYPAEASLKQIYRCFNHALLKLHPNLKCSIDPLNDSMVEFYLVNQSKFTPDIAPQYIYSPRELSRWVSNKFYKIIYLCLNLINYF